MPPPPIGAVNNVQPASRQERKAQCHREDLEKMRLRNRREGYCHYEEGGVTPPPDALGFISEADRFITDVALVEKQDRDASIASREQMFNGRRGVRADTEEKRWRTIEMEHQMDQQREQTMRQDASYGKSNKTSMPYNPISLAYADGPDGECLRYSDDALKHRSALRADNLQRRTNNGYNPITGEPVQKVVVPSAPAPPGFMLG